jgi:dTDP-4-amino-4,6-dideoxygalactose transaminase
MSEAQAAIGLLNLDDLPASLRHNDELFAAYRRGLATIGGTRLVEPTAVDRTNHQYVVVAIDPDAFGLSRDQLLRVLAAENIGARRYFYPGLHRIPPYRETLPQYLDALPQTDRLCQLLIQLPIGALVDATAVERICGLIAAAHDGAESIRGALEAGR